MHTQEVECLNKVTEDMSRKSTERNSQNCIERTTMVWKVLYSLYLSFSADLRLFIHTCTHSIQEVHLESVLKAVEFTFAQPPITHN